MKKHLIIFGLIFAVFTTFAQEVKTDNKAKSTADTATMTGTVFCPHRINVYLGGSYANSLFTRMEGMKTIEGFNGKVSPLYSFGSIIELKYAYFFNQHWGISTGLGLGYYGSGGRMRFEGVEPNWSDDGVFNPYNKEPYVSGEKEIPTGAPENPVYDLHYLGTGITDRQHLFSLEIPLQAVFEYRFDGKNGIYGGMGVKWFITPFRVINNFKGSGELTTWGYEEYTDAWYTFPNHFVSGEYKGMSSKDKVKWYGSVDLSFDFGALVYLTPKVDLYLGIYGSVNPWGNLMYVQPDLDKDIYPEGVKHFFEGTMDQDGKPVLEYNPLLVSDYFQSYNEKRPEGSKKIDETWNIWQIGGKIGFHIKPCGGSNEPSMREMRKKMMQDIGRIADNTQPIKDIADNTKDIAKNTKDIADALKDTLNVYALTPKNYEKDNNLTPQDKDNIRRLAEKLSGAKILFDLDKDIPKYNNTTRDNIDEAVAILKQDRSLGLNIEGYTCDLGSETHNQDLAKRRALAVRQIFIDKGVQASQITTEGFTFNTDENRRNIPEKNREEHRAAIFRIIKK